jgi:16S rRNA (guanine966-N2)-methyltransferase
VIRQLASIKDKLRADAVTLLRGDALASAQSMSLRGQRFKLIFLDPPYQQDFLSKALPLCQNLLVEDGLVYVESGAPLPFAEAGEGEMPDWLAPWEAIRGDKAGIVFYYLLTLRTEPA